MQLIPCPFCGPRAEIEFVYDRAAEAAPGATDRGNGEELDRIFKRENPRGVHIELWQHVSGCRKLDTGRAQHLRTNHRLRAGAKRKIMKPRRLGRPCSLVDFKSPVSFRFDGKSCSGFQGDTLASALLANGVRVVGRSFKYHRRRGVFAIGAEEPNALVEIGEGVWREPNTRATQIALYEGLVARSQNRWPSLWFDVLSAYDALSAVLGAGFYYKTFKWPPSWWPLYEQYIRGPRVLERRLRPEIR